MAKKQTELKKQLINAIMKYGKKKTSEKILLKSLKLIQKENKKHYAYVLKQAIINSTPTFKINKQSKKHGKKKSNQEIPTFIKTDSLRMMMSLNYLVFNSNKKNDSLNFYKKITQEILNTSFNKSKTIDQKNQVQEQVLSKKRYLSNFKWKY